MTTKTKLAIGEIPLVLFQNERFRVELTEFYDTNREAVVVGYGIVNLDTDVQEAESRRLAIAITLADVFALDSEGGISDRSTLPLVRSQKLPRKYDC